MSRLNNPRIWTSFVIATDLKTQWKIIKKLKPLIEQFDHYNFNYYAGEMGPDHLSIRVYGKGKKQLAEEIFKLCEKYPIIHAWKQSYGAKERRAYEFGTRCAFLYMDMKKYFLRGKKLNYLFLPQAIHGFFDNIGIGDKAEGKLHLTMAWHFLVKKPFYLKIRKLKMRLKRKHRKNF